MSGKYEAKRRRPRARAPRAPRAPRERRKLTMLLSRRALVWLLIAAASLAAAGVCFARLHAVTTCLYSQQAAERWRGQSETRFSQVSVFLPVDGGIDVQTVETFRQSIDTAMQEVSLEAPEGGSLYVDAYSGSTRLSVYTDHGSAMVQTLGVGGDFFTFHPLRLRSGGYLTGSDYMADRVVLDEALAWTLFGSYDVAGQQVMVGERPYLVAGVVAREDDYASEKAYSGDAGMFMSYDALNLISETPIDCYEVVMADPITGYARSVVEKSFSPETDVIVENSARYKLINLIGVLGDFGERSMQTYAVILPYWENAARLTEDHAALALLLGALFSLCPAGVAGYWAVHWLRKLWGKLRRSVADTVERKVEEKKEKHYVRTGI